MKKIIVFIYCLLSITLAMAQSVAVTGIVVAEEDGSPIVGVAVTVPGTYLGVSTDLNGKFSIRVPEGAQKLVFSFIGMQTQEVEIRPEMRVVMRNEAKQLEEVIVSVAYGTAEKSSLTGAISSISKESIERRPVSNVAAVLEGNAVGVQVNNTMGQPGEEPTILIRGIGTVNGSTSPLYVIDGVPFEGNVSDLNPADIESLSVLKDAASCALFGNRGANGIILITTKRGSSDKFNLNLNVKQGVYMRGLKEYKRANPYQFMEAMWQNMRNQYMTKNKVDVATAGAYASAKLIPSHLYLNIFNKPDGELFDADGHLTPGTKILPGYAGDLDWYDAALRNGYRQEYTMSGGRASDRSDTYFSLGYLNEDGYAANVGFDRLSARLSFNFEPVKWLKTGVNLSGTHQTSRFMKGNGANENSYSNIYMFARQIAPIYPVHLHNPDGSYRLDVNGDWQYDIGSYVNDEGRNVLTRNQNKARNVVWESELNSDKTIRNTMNGIAYITANLWKGLTFTLKGNLSTGDSEEQYYNNAIVGDGAGTEGLTSRTRYRTRNYTFQQQLNWKGSFGRHYADVLLAHENYAYDRSFEYGSKNTETFVGESFLSNFKNITKFYGYDDQLRSESYLGRIRYNYDSRYNAEVSFRRDGSSRFAKEHRWGNFGSVGVNWVVSNEDFMKEVAWVDMLKFRANWGQVGSDAGAGWYAYTNLYQSTQNANHGAYYRGKQADKNLKWETGESWSIAAETRLFNRWNMEIEYFNRRNKDLLFDVYRPLSVGATTTTDEPASAITCNLGTIANRGLEITTDADVYRAGKWHVNLSANVAFIRNKVIKLPEQNKNGISDAYTKIVEGKSRYEFYLPTFAGVDRLTGDALYVADLENNYVETQEGVIGNPEGGNITKNVTLIDGAWYVNNTTYALKEFHGSALPKMFGSFGLNVSYASLRLSALFTSALGGKTYDGVYQSFMKTSAEPKSLHADIMKSWQEAPADMTEQSPGRIDPKGVPVINYDKSDANNAISSRWLTKSNYLVLKNITLNYTLPTAWIRRLDLQGIDLNVSCDNLFTLTARRGMNPQQSFDGMQKNYIVSARVISAGISFKL
ncbi:MAG: SusC/RagA family TonB-linked outer membrane protein [Odoribacter sp.]|nr:SusC/RagA family TonB-linked outer membrane protein [Odoribacter sp.]